jgi:8-oxo-dGTP pyrophosphatase MutT (NUDIX family)
MKSRSEVSAGGVVYRIENGQLQFLIVKDAGYHRWVLPKGLVRKSEDYAAAAQREVHEETGVDTEVIQSLGEPETYIYTARGMRVFKSVHYYLMRYISGAIVAQDREIEEVRWVTPDAGLEMLAYGGAKIMLRRSLMILEQEQSAQS